MDEKPDAGLIGIVVAVPLLVLLCCLGPLILLPVLAGIAGGLSGVGLGAILGAVLAVAAAAYGVLRWRRASLERAGIEQSCGPFGGACDMLRRADAAEPQPKEAPEPILPEGHKSGQRANQVNRVGVRHEFE